jgi:hypothetical protein
MRGRIRGKANEPAMQIVAFRSPPSLSLYISGVDCSNTPRPGSLNAVALQKTAERRDRRQTLYLRPEQVLLLTLLEKNEAFEAD